MITICMERDAVVVARNSSTSDSSAFHANATARSATAATTTSMMPSILPVAPAFRAADLPLNQDIGSVLVNATWELGGVGDDDAARPTNVTPPPMIMVDVDVDGCLC